jgi:ribonuclease HII
MTKGHILPSLDYETPRWAAGYLRVAGLDEAGRGAWAGPVVAAAVVLPPGDCALLERLRGVRDSKQLTPKQREALLGAICECAVVVGVGAVPPDEIDRLGIVPATRQAMVLALAAISPPADYLLIDYLHLFEVPLPQYSLPKGDVRVLSIAAASIVAKVSRDRMMVELEERLPGYGFGRHKGYGTAEHQAALAALGPSPVHRLSFAPVSACADRLHHRQILSF